jgi:hypothetical protein
MKIENLDFASCTTLNEYFIDACRQGDLEEVKRINAKFKPAIKSNNKFIRIAQNIMDKFKSNQLYIDVHYYDDRCLRYACDKGQIEVVKYLLTSDELVEKSNINVENDYPFTVACMRGDFELVKYLCSSPELKKHSNINSNNQHGNGILIAYEDNHMDIVRVLVFDMNINKTKCIEDYIKEQNAEGLEQIFQTRELHKTLLSELQPQLNQQKKKLKV